jgi:hypothetical protein
MQLAISNSGTFKLFEYRSGSTPKGQQMLIGDGKVALAHSMSWNMRGQMHIKSARYFSDPGAPLFSSGALLFQVGAQVFRAGALLLRAEAQLSGFPYKSLQKSRKH